MTDARPTGLRRGDRSWIATALCLLVAASFPLFAFHQVVFGAKTLQTSTLAGLTSTNGFDPVTPEVVPVGAALPDAGASAWQTEPWIKAVSRAYRSGELPLWNPFQGAGKPFAANTISTTFDPLMVAAIAHPSPRITDLSIIGAYCLGAMAMFAFVRSLRARRLAALTSAFVFSFGGYWFFNYNNLFSRAYIYIPILLFLANMAIAKGIGPWTFALALGITSSIVVGMPESTFIVLVTVGVYVVYRLVTQAPGRRLAAWGNTVIAGALGLMMAAPLLALFAEYEGLSFNTHKAGSDLGRVSSPLHVLVTWFAPPLNGTSARGWVGSAAFALVVIGSAASMRFLRARQALPFWIIGGFFAWKFYGLPGASTFGGLPVVNQVKWETFGPPALQAVLAVLAGLGMDALLRRQVRLRRLGWVAAGAVVVAVALLLTKDGTDGAATRSSTRERFALAIVGVVVVGVGAVLAQRSTRSRVRAVGAALIVCTVAVQMVILVPTLHFANRLDAFGEQPWYQWVDAAREGSGGTPARVFGLDGKLFPDTATAAGIYDIRTLDALYVDRYHRFIDTFVEGGFYDRYVGMDHFSGETGTQYVDNPMFDLLGVRYLLSGWSLPGSIVEDLALRLPAEAPDSEVEVRTVSVQGTDHLAVAMPPGTATAVPAPEGATEVHGAVFNPSSTAPATFTIVGLTGATEQTIATLAVPPGIGPAAIAGPVPAGTDRVELRVSGPDPEVRTAWFDLAFSDAAGAPMSSQYRFVGRGNLTSVWENLDPTPRAFVVHDVERVDGPAAARRRMLDGATRLPGGAYRVGDFDPFTTAVVEGDAPVDTGSCDTASTVTFTSYEPGEVRLQVDAPCPGLLVLTDTYYPGWAATVNGESTEVLATDLAFRGVAVPAGRSEVVFTYRPTHFRAAASIALLAFLAGIGICCVPWLRRRRAAAAAEMLPTESGTSGSVRSPT